MFLDVDNETSQTKKHLVLNVFNKTYTRIFFVILIFVFALSIRLFYVLNNPITYGHGIGEYNDSHLYHRIAFNLYSGNGFSGIDNGSAYGLVQGSKDIKYEPAIVRGPVYPFFIYIVYKFFADPKDMESIKTWHKNWDKVRIAQSILDATVCILVFFIVKSISPTSFLPAIISALLYSLSLHNIYYVKVILSESVTTFILTAAILLFISALRKKGIKWWLSSGMGFGIVVLSRPEYSLSLFILMAFIIIANRSFFSDAFKKSLIFIIGAFIVISPWTLRNFMIFKKPILVAESGLGTNLFLGTLQDGGDNFPDEYPEDDKMSFLGKGYIRTLSDGTIEYKSFDNAFLKIALNRIRENPGEIFQTWIKSILRLWKQPQIYRVKFPLNLFFVFYIFFAAYAFYRGEKREEKILMAPVFLLFIYLNLIFFPFHKEVRYGIAIIPGLISLSGIGIHMAISRMINLLQKLFAVSLSEDHK